MSLINTFTIIVLIDQFFLSLELNQDHNETVTTNPTKPTPKLRLNNHALAPALSLSNQRSLAPIIIANPSNSDVIKENHLHSKIVDLQKENINNIFSSNQFLSNNKIVPSQPEIILESSSSNHINNSNDDDDVDDSIGRCSLIDSSSNNSSPRSSFTSVSTSVLKYCLDDDLDRIGSFPDQEKSRKQFDPINFLHLERRYHTNTESELVASGDDGVKRKWDNIEEFDNNRDGSGHSAHYNNYCEGLTNLVINGGRLAGM